MARVRRKNWKRIGTLILVTAGIVLLYPLMTDFYGWYEQGQLKEQLEDQPALVAGEDSKSLADTPQGDYVPVVPWGLIEIPEIGVSATVVVGTERPQLSHGPGWYPQSALPGQGNTYIAGHRSTYGAPFRNLYRLHPGSKISITYKDQVYNYEVEKVVIIKNDDWSLTRPCGYNALTLTSCTPLGLDKRLAVRAREVDEQNQGKEQEQAD